MRGRIGVVVLVVGLFTGGLAAGAIHAGPTSPPATTGETTTEPPTDETTTTAASSTATATTAPMTTATPTLARNVLEAGPPIGDRCLVVAAFALLQPDGQVRVLGQAAEPPRVPVAALRNVAYPADGSIVTASSVSLRARGCGDRGTARGLAEVRSLSLFGGVVTARTVELGVHGTAAGGGIVVEGLTIARKAVTFRAGRPLPVGNWGYAIALAQPDRTEAGALAVHLSKAHSGLPAGTVLFVSFARVPHAEAEEATPKRRTATKRVTTKRVTPKPMVHVGHRVRDRRTATHSKRHRRRAHKRLGDEPLTMTPPLGLSRYVFPVGGESSYVDTYGAFRGDVPGNWHHGDDIFAPLGAPVLAVADGTLNRVGWERLGGWRLWVRDTKRNEFYYAHLSGYSPLALHSKHVKAGDVIGFIGNTGDAFTTSPHLHFEIHPHQLLRLDYNGAVNPTGYLDEWQHLAHPRPPKPAHPPFPSGAVRAEAHYIWRQLLAARGLISHAPRVSERPRISVPGTDRAFPARRMAAAGGPHARHVASVRLLDVFAGLVAPALLFGSALWLRLRRKQS